MPSQTPGHRTYPMEPGQGIPREASALSSMVLIVEDSPVNRALVISLVEQLGYRADIASNGEEAVAAAALHRYLMILMDLQMPEMDGFEAARAIRHAEGGMMNAEQGKETPPHSSIQRSPFSAHRSHRVPIIAVTGSDSEDLRSHVLEAGMDDLLQKPLTLERLKAMIDRWTVAPRVNSLPNEPPQV